MAVFRQELNWSEYQNRQLKVLEDIEKSMSDNLVISKNLFSNMSKIEYAITSIAHASETSAKNLSAITKDLIGHSEEFNSRMEHASSVTRDFTLSLGDSNNSLREFDRRVDSAGNTLTSTIGNIATTLWDKLGGLRALGDSADKFSKASNQMIKLSGMDGSTVRDFRSDIMSEVASLNLATGSAYSPLASYDKLISVSQGITSNLDAIQEMARPLLLTQEALDVDMSTVADLFNRFYTRYSFSSEHMESTLDEIRGNTAGNSANAEATFENINKLESYINLIAGNDNDMRSELTEEISQFTSYLENYGAASDVFADYLKNILGGDYSDKGLLAMLSYGGMDPGSATSIARSGDFTKVIDALLKGSSAISSMYWENGTFNYSKAVENFGLDVDFANAANSITKSKNFTSIDEFLADQSLKNPKSMEELVEDKFVSAADKANNWLELIYEKLAWVQEYLPFGVSDIITVMAATKGIFGGSGGRGAAGGAGLLAKAGRNLGAGAHSSNAAASMTGALGVAGVAAGIGMAGYGVLEGIEDLENGDKGLAAGNFTGAGLALGGAGSIGAGMLGAGAAAGPIGWAALALGGIALVATDAAEALATVGSADAVEKAYEEAAEAISDKSRKQERSLGLILSDLDKYDEIINSSTASEAEKNQANLELEGKRKELIDLGILSEEDVNTARTGNIEALQELTKAYLSAKQEWSGEQKSIINEYKQRDTKLAGELHGDLEEFLQDLNDTKILEKSGSQLTAVEDLFFSMKMDLDEMVANGTTLDDTTQSFYDSLVKAFKSGGLDAGEANDIIDNGAWNTVFQNASLGPELIMNALESMKYGSTTGKANYNKLMKDRGSFYGTDKVMAMMSVLEELSIGKSTGSMTVEKATELLDSLKSQGITSANGYEHVAEAAAEWGLEGYATGSNYIEKDQLALLHEGEAVVPKKYNPAANTAGIRAIASSVVQSQAETKEVFLSFIEELAEIKVLLSEWRKDGKISEIKSRHSANSRFINSFMTIEN